VLFHYRPQRRLEQFASASGQPPDTLRKRFIDSGYSRSCDAGRLKADAACEEGIRLLGQRIGFARFRALWITAFEPDPAVVDLAVRLKQRLPLALLTNNSELVRSELEARYPEVLALFRPSLFSAEAGLLKPDPRLFRTLLNLMDLAPEQALYVDDEPAHADAAEALGLATHRYRSAELLERDLYQRGLLG